MRSRLPKHTAVPFHETKIQLVMHCVNNEVNPKTKVLRRYRAFFRRKKINFFQKCGKLICITSNDISG